jgi:hypothetical protein
MRERVSARAFTKTRADQVAKDTRKRSGGVWAGEYGRGSMGGNQAEASVKS